MTGQRVLPPDVFDALEFSALVYGGIGWNIWYLYDDNRQVRAPVCYVGHLAFVGVIPEATTAETRQFGISGNDNDAVFDGDELYVPFAEWCRRLNVVRADTPTFDPALFPSKRGRKS